MRKDRRESLVCRDARVRPDRSATLDWMDKRERKVCPAAQVIVVAKETLDSQDLLAKREIAEKLV